MRRTAVEFLSAHRPRGAWSTKLAPLLFDPVRAVRTLAGSRLAGAPDELLKPYQREQLAEVIAEYVADMRYSLDFAFAGHNLGNLYVAARRAGEGHRGLSDRPSRSTTSSSRPR